MTRRLPRIILALHFFAALAGQLPVHAAPLDCPEILRQFDRRATKTPSASELLNSTLAAKYPDLKQVLEDPDRFVASMEKRFRDQKALTPQTPYQFDFSDFGIPVIKDMDRQLNSKIAELRAYQSKLGSNWMRRTVNGTRIENVDLGIRYLRELRTEVRGILSKGKVSYQDLYELSYFHSRAIGHFDTRDYSLQTKFFLEIDRRQDGYRQLSIEDEYAIYRKRDFKVFQVTSWIDGFKPAEETFGKALVNPDRLEIILIPTTVALDRDILNRLVPYDIYLTAITDVPIPADGFLRPGGDFWMHDIRHSSVIYEERRAYLEKNHVTPEQWRAIQKKSDQWQVDLHEKIKTVKNAELKEAIEFLFFNYHHDRGYPMVPSMYLPEKPGQVPYRLYFVMEVNDQPTGFGRPVKNIRGAYEWLKDFWLPRLSEELEITGMKLQELIPQK